MTTLRRISLLSIAVLSALNVRLAHAEKMNLETQDLVIKKVERVLSVISPKDPSYNASQQRLADLLAERARELFMLEVEANCEGCKGSSKDRERAIAIYEDLLKRTDISEHGRILFQLAHLYEMAGNIKSAINLLEEIVKSASKKNISQKIVTRAHSGLGDLYFQSNDFTKAKLNYEIALKDKNLENRALVTYNMAWCDFNNDKLSGAIRTLETLTATKNLIVRDTEDGSKYDSAFHADIMRDLATFYSRQPITDRNITQYEKLSPADSQKQLMFHFANEANRIGQKQAAAKILNRYTAREDLTKMEALEALVMTAQVNYDRGQTAQSTKDFEAAAKAFKSTDCKDQCDKIQSSMKRYVTEVHRTKKLKPDADLMSAYATYNATFKDDYEMAVRAAQIAVEVKSYAKGVELYREISENRRFTDKQRQEALINEISTAEKSDDLKLRRTAYAHFLKRSNNETKNFEVMYQLAYISYQEKDFKGAMEAFNDLATSKKGTESLKKKAADLALDSGAILKDDEKVQKLSWNYAKVFPKHKVEFETIARKALMNEVAMVANSPKASSSDLKSLLRKVESTDLKTASASDKILHFKNQSVLAKKTDNDSSYISATRSLLAMKEVSAQEKDQLNENLAAYYEQKLDFKNAYASALKVKNPKTSEKENEFRLGTLADIAGLQPQRHYNKALKLGINGKRSQIMRTRLVHLSKNPVRELNNQLNDLKQNPSLLNETALLVYAKTNNKSAMRRIFEMRELRNQPVAGYFSRQDQFTDAANFDKRIASHKMNLKNERTQNSSIKTRSSYLGEADRRLLSAVNAKDVTLQLMNLNTVARENERMASDINKLPLPKGLNEVEMKQYQTALAQTIRPFMMKSQEAKKQMENILNNNATLNQLAKDYASSRPEIQKLLNREMGILVDLPGSGASKSAIAKALDSNSYTSKDLASARKSAENDPTNARALEKLLQIETKMGHPLMPSYLEVRLNQIQKGKRL